MSSFDTNNILELTHTTPGVESGTSSKLFFGRLREIPYENYSRWTAKKTLLRRNQYFMRVGNNTLEVKIPP
jgi:hypothetical protein